MVLLRLIKLLLLGLVLSLVVSPELTLAAPKKARAIASKTIKEVIIQGQRKIESSAITQKLKSKEGTEFSDDQIREDVLELFKLGYFVNIEVDRADRPDGIVLTFRVVEKPSIGAIIFEGNSEVKSDDLREAVEIKAFELVDHGKIRTAVEKLEKLYEDKGYFLARIKYRLEEMPDQQVRLVFGVEEGDKVKVQKITFLGNRKLPSGKLKAIMLTQEGGFFSFISSSGAYKQEAFERDLQALNFLYFNEGFVQVKIDQPQVYVTPDKSGIFITIRIDEGEQFKVGSVDFAGDLLFESSEMREAVAIDDAELFKYETLQTDLRELQAKYGDLGYAFANVIPRPRLREQDREVDVTFEIEKGSKVYIGKINVIGNTKTRDKVLRRELRIREGELYNESRKRESQDNVRRLGFFEDVNFNVKTPPGRNDIMDIDIVVKERNTGTIQAGAGYSTFQGFILQGQVNQTNLGGRGQVLGASVNISKIESLFRFSFTEPYFKDTLWSTGVDVYQNRRILFGYSETKRGGAVRLGHPLAPYLNGFLRYKLDDAEMRLDPEQGDPEIFDVSTANGITSSVTATIEYDKRNDRFAPTKGNFASASLEYAGLGGDLRYTKGFLNLRHYQKVFWELVWRNNLVFGFVSPNQGRGSVPFNELFLLGGANSLRGYQWFRIGTRRKSDLAYTRAISAGYSAEQAQFLAMVPYGGRQQFYYNLEFEFPMIQEAGVRGVVFYDIGNADDVLTLSGMRHSVGLGFRWFSPIGPLRFEWGFPLDRRPEYQEEPVIFQFAIGAPF